MVRLESEPAREFDWSTTCPVLLQVVSFMHDNGDEQLRARIELELFPIIVGTLGGPQAEASRRLGLLDWLIREAGPAMMGLVKETASAGAALRGLEPAANLGGAEQALKAVEAAVAALGNQTARSKRLQHGRDDPKPS